MSGFVNSSIRMGLVKVKTNKIFMLKDNRDFSVLPLEEAPSVFFAYLQKWGINDLVSLLEYRKSHQSDFEPYHYLKDGEALSESIKFGELSDLAKGIAASLQEVSRENDRIMLLYLPGIDFIAAFFGCLYAKRIAIPLPPPRQSRMSQTLEKILEIVRSAHPAVVLTSRAIKGRAQEYIEQFPELAALRWVATDDLAPGIGKNWRSPAINPNDIATLQYTSGSTSIPKGVILTHRNIMYNLMYFDQAGLHTWQSRILTWLPPFHDLGLVYGLLMPVYRGIACYILPNAAFIQRPSRWLEAISRFRVTHTAGPNFSYDLCIESTPDELLPHLDLSCLEYALNGAEPVRMKTMQLFAERFSPTGFDVRAFSPSWGLAEATCIVSGASSGVPGCATKGRKAPDEVWVDGVALQRNQVCFVDQMSVGAISCVSSGYPIADTRLLIVDPETLTPCRSDQVGEIWVRNEAVSQGYWQNSEKTQETFYNLTGDGSQEPWMRTGDLGFIALDQIFITGRIKDVIIVRGQNHYPQDIEWSVDKSHPLLKLGGAAAFSLASEGEEQLVVAVETTRRFKGSALEEEIFTAVRRVVSEVHGLQVVAIVLLREGTLPKTTSGKVQRSATRELFISGRLSAVAQWAHRGMKAQFPVLAKSPTAGMSETAIREWLRARIAGVSGLNESEVDDERVFGDFGLDSKLAVQLTGELENAFGFCSLPPSLMFDYPSIARLSKHLCGRQHSIHRLATIEPVDERSEIAVVGMAGRFPGAADVESFWKLLCQGGSAIAPLPQSRQVLVENWVSEVGEFGEAGWLDGIDLFDPILFQISPREAELMDPQQRLLLLTVWRALENAGISRQELASSATGVFIGISGTEYSQFAWQSSSSSDGHIGTGTALSIAANRLSYWLDLRGPSLAVDTACSSSLVAVHLACQSILRGECDTALVGGVNLILNPALTKALRKAGMLSPTAACHTFDSRADGYVRGEGVGIVILRKPQLAEKRGNRVLALVAGSAVNQDGHSFGLTAPNGVAQRELLMQACESARIRADEMDFVEAHGTGTRLGDPIEIGALADVLGESRKSPCLVGSVKANIGHLEAAAGIAGFIKAVLCLERKVVPPLAGFHELQPELPLQGKGLVIATELKYYDKDHPLSVVGVTSMGFGGTNAHVILRQAQPFESSEPKPQRSHYSLLLSVERDEDLAPLAAAILERLRDQPASWASLCHAVNTGLSSLPYRTYLVAANSNELATQLSGLTDECPTASTRLDLPAKPLPPLVFVFSGQGIQYPGMARELYANSPVFRAVVDECDAVLKSEGLPEVSRQLFGPDALNAEQLAEPINAQPSLFVVGYAMARYYESCGLAPSMVLGHSLGEYAAACFAGALTLADAMRIVALRAQLIQRCSERGRMLAVLTDADTALNLINGDCRLSLAADNSTAQVALSGDWDALKEFAERARIAGIAVTPLKVKRAFHSSHMDPILDEFRATVGQFECHTPRIPVIGNLAGVPVERFDADYWAAHLRQTVLFRACLGTVMASGGATFLEIGPQPVLSPLLRRLDSHPMVVSSLDSRRQDWLGINTSLADLWRMGYSPDFRLAWAGECFDKITLPEYPFRLSSYWLKPVSRNAMPTIATPTATDLKEEIIRLISPLLKQSPQEIDPRRSFLEIGADSLVLTELSRMIAESYGVNVAMAQLFGELSSITLLADAIASHAATPKANQTSEAASPAMPVPQTQHEQVRMDVPAIAVTGLQGVLERQLEAFNQLVRSQIDLLSGNATGFVTQATTTPPPTPIVSPPVALATLAPDNKGTGLGVGQQRHIDELASDYGRKHAGSKRYATNHRAVFADYRSSLGFRRATKEMIFPLVVNRAEGSRVFDVDGNEFIDLTMGFGSNLLGYNSPLVKDALLEQLDYGIQVGPKSPLTGEAAALIAKLTGCERVAFANSGTEAVMTAVRLARTVTGRTRIVRFTGSYHGHSDTMLVKAGRDGNLGLPAALGVPSAVALETIVLPYGEEESLDVIARHGSELAAVVVEPVQSRRPGLKPRDFLHRLRGITSNTSCALIFDEIITGFRLAPGGAQEYFGVRADLVTYGKVVAGGMPIGVIAGVAKFMNAIDGGLWNFGDDSCPTVPATFFAGTFSGHPLTMAVTVAVMSHLIEQGPSLQSSVAARTDRLVHELNHFFEEEGFAIKATHACSLFRFVFFDNYSVEFQPIEANLFFYHMTMRGVYIWEGHTCFLSTAHSDADVDRIVLAARESAQALRQGGFFPRPAGMEVSSVQHSPEGMLQSLNDFATALVADALFMLDGLPKEPGGKVNFERAAAWIGVVPARKRMFYRLFSILAESGWLSPVADGWELTRIVRLNAFELEASARHQVDDSVVSLLRHCAAALPDILRGHREPTEVLFSSENFGLLNQLYRLAPASQEAHQYLASTVTRALNVPRTVSKLLEIGAGTGSTTARILPALDGMDVRYLFTDVSSAFLHRAQREFAAYNNIEYMVFDADLPPDRQGYELYSLDVILAANVVHATKDISRTLGHLRSLLKPGGRLLLLECIGRQPWLDVIFGLTDGWWAFSDTGLRPDYPLIDIQDWANVLKQQGFDHVDSKIFGNYQAVIEARIPVVTHLPITPAQREILVHLDLGGDIGAAYNETMLFEVTGSLNPGFLAQAWDQVLARHESLRAAIREDRQHVEIMPIVDAPVIEVDFSDFAPKYAETKAHEWILVRSSSTFDLSHPPLIRCFLIRFAPDRHWLLFIAHHLVIDGLSYGSLVQELADIYQGLTEGSVPTLAQALSLDEANRRLAQFQHQENSQFWAKLYRDDVPVLDLPINFPRPSRQSFAADRILQSLEDRVSAGMKALAQQWNVTPFMFLLGAFRLLLNKLSGQQSSVIGVPVSMHTEQSGECFIGFGVNVLPILGETPSRIRFADYVQRVKQEFLEAHAHRHLHFADLIREINPERDPSRPVLVAALFNYESIHTLDVGTIQIAPAVPPTRTTKYEITLDALAEGDTIKLVLTYNTALFAPGPAEKLLARFSRLIANIVARPESCLGEFDLLLEEEVQGLGMNPPRPFANHCIHRLFEAQAVRVPGAPALRFNAEEISYRELDERANRLAHLLIEYGVGVEDRVAVCLPRAPDLIIALLAVLKAGACYVPVDPNYPKERQSVILDCAAARLLIVESAEQQALGPGQAVLALQSESARCAACPATSPDVSVRPEHLAYIIFTSGSTGTPKGVAIEHRNAASMIEWAESEFSLNEGDGILASTSVCFDLSVYEIFFTLAIGRKIILVENILYLPELAQKDDITLINTVPSAMEELIRSGVALPSLRYVNLAGEALPLPLVQAIQQAYPDIPVYNLYGPSEDTTYSTFVRFPSHFEGPVTIGRPVQGSRLYLLDDDLNPVPTGCKGHVYMAGNGLCRGYFGNSKATAAAFLPDAFSAEPGARMYHTGDIGCLNASGDIEFLGRRDDQLKIRGHRIELGEIESVLSSVPGVQRIVVATEGNGSRQRLIAFFTTSSNSDPSEELKRHAAAKLPQFMMPSGWIRLVEFPLSPNGKIDRNKLVGLAHGGGVSSLTALIGQLPRNALEQEIADIWATHLQLGCERLHIDDDFFSLGGHSLLATQILHEINARIGCHLRLTDIMQHPSIAGLAEAVLEQALTDAPNFDQLLEDLSAQ